MTDRERILIYAAHRISPEIGYALEDVFRTDNPTQEQHDRLYKLLLEQVGNPRIPKDVYIDLLEAVRRPAGK